MNNPYMTAEDNFYAEQYNGAIALCILGEPQITLELPLDYDGHAFLEGLQKCKFVLVNLILTNTIISGNKIQLAPGQTTGKARFRVYPNIEPLKQWIHILFTATKTTGTVTCNVYNGGDKDTLGTTLVKSNISNPEDLSDEAIGLEFVDFEFTLTQVSGNNPTLDTIDIKVIVGV
ncbi:hypothetical protein [Methanobacterium sp.]|uniref:hypothetical protein n=1 Tax=Methanobacterium sp. TaxID=2164 RepID=UPI003C70D295